MRKNIVLRNLFIGTALVVIIVACDNYAAQQLPRPDKDRSYQEPSPPDIKEPSYNDGLIIDGKEVPVSEELKRFLVQEGYSTITLTNEKGEVKIVNQDGKQIEPCGFIDGTRIEGKCNLKGIEFQNVNVISIWISESNPKCTTKKIGGRLIQAHADAKSGSWQAGNFPCHEGIH